MEDNMISSMLSIVLIFAVVILVVLVIVYIILRAKTKEKKKKREEVNLKKEDTVTREQEYNKKSVINFMEFDDIMDNMIIQKNGKRYLMVVECQGVNYDLMSEMEKVAVEEGFQQFLNTLRHPIQIYIQTRTVNLESSLQTYKTRVNDIEGRYTNLQYTLKKMNEDGYYSEEEIKRVETEITKIKNLLDYGKDIIKNTEKMSKNRNVLNKKYYIVIAYSTDDLGNNNYDKDELRGRAFSELYTKAQSLISTLSACSVTGKILNSLELAELLYVAYNRDEAETYDLEREIRAGIMEMYSIAPDVLEKKIKILDQQIQNDAVDMANQHIQKAKSRLQKIVEEKQKSREELVEEMAKLILQENQDYIGQDVAQEAINELEKTIEEESKKTRGRKKKKEETVNEKN
mgnify:CR=1 FL=1